MFKKKGQFRKKVTTDDAEDDEETSSTTNVQSKAKAASSFQRGSAFSYEEDEGDGTDFKAKKSKASRNIKKMSQAPNALSAITTHVEVTETVAIDSGSAYSADNLAALRQQQQFTITATEDDAGKSLSS